MKWPVLLLVSFPRSLVAAGAVCAFATPPTPRGPGPKKKKEPFLFASLQLGKKQLHPVQSSSGRGSL